MDKLKAISEEAIKLSKIHGVVHIGVNKHIPVRILWLVCVFVSAGACSYLMIVNILNYLEYDVITKLSIIKDSNSIFPAISICNSVPFVTKNSSNFIKGLFEQPLFKQFENFTDNDQQLEPTKTLAQYFSEINTNNLSNEIKKSFGLKTEQMFLSCLYRGSICLASDFEWYYDLIYGNCYRFNSGLNKTLKTATTIGKWNGLRLELFVGSTNDVEISQQSTGVHIFIHNNTDKPNSYEGIDVPTGKETNIGLSRTFLYRLNDPYSDCVNEFSSYVYKILVDLNGRYSYDECIKLCFQELVIERCKCQEPTSPILNKTIRTCSEISDLFLCIYPSYAYFFNQDTAQKCPYCKHECENIIFEYSSSVNSYPSEKYANFLFRLKQIKESNITSYEKLKRNVVSLNIFYDNLQYKVIQELPLIDILTLISNIGGILGLFLGMSFINVMELVEYLCEIIFLFSPKLIEIFSLSKKKEQNQLDNKNRKDLFDNDPFKSLA